MKMRPPGPMPAEARSQELPQRHGTVQESVTTELLAVRIGRIVCLGGA